MPFEIETPPFMADNNQQHGASPHLIQSNTEGNTLSAALRVQTFQHTRKPILMSIMLFINLFLLAVCLFLIVLGISRNLARKKARFQAIQNQASTQQWLQTHLSEVELRDLQAIRQHFQISMSQAKQLRDQFLASHHHTSH